MSRNVVARGSWSSRATAAPEISIAWSSKSPRIRIPRSSAGNAVAVGFSGGAHVRVFLLGLRPRLERWGHAQGSSARFPKRTLAIGHDGRVIDLAAPGYQRSLITLPAAGDHRLPRSLLPYGYHAPVSGIGMGVDDLQERLPRHLKLRELRVLLAVAEQGSFRKAGDGCST